MIDVTQNVTGDLFACRGWGSNKYARCCTSTKRAAASRTRILALIRLSEAPRRGIVFGETALSRRPEQQRPRRRWLDASWNVHLRGGVPRWRWTCTATVSDVSSLITEESAYRQCGDRFQAFLGPPSNTGSGSRCAPSRQLRGRRRLPRAPAVEKPVELGSVGKEAFRDV